MPTAVTPSEIAAQVAECQATEDAIVLAVNCYLTKNFNETDPAAQISFSAHDIDEAMCRPDFHTVRFNVQRLRDIVTRHFAASWRIKTHHYWFCLTPLRDIIAPSEDQP